MWGTVSRRVSHLLESGKPLRSAVTLWRKQWVVSPVRSLYILRSRDNNRELPRLPTSEAERLMGWVPRAALPACGHQGNITCDTEGVHLKSKSFWDSCLSDATTSVFSHFWTPAFQKSNKKIRIPREKEMITGSLCGKMRTSFSEPGCLEDKTWYKCTQSGHVG